ncbi:MAG: hypothetical protein P8J00_08775 [Yoonia sp.]|nr:hypothetical protein [Yoonia sp.]MDG1867830.1 hypothetical protein [Yoonia sp.]
MIRKLLICAFVFWAQGALAEGPTEPTVRPLGRGEVIPLRAHGAPLPAARSSAWRANSADIPR